MEKYSYTVPMVSGAKKAFEINDEKGLSKAKIQRYYSHLLNIITEIVYNRLGGVI